MFSIEGSKRYKKWLSSYKPVNDSIVKYNEANTTAATFLVTIQKTKINYCTVYWSLTKGKPELAFFALGPSIEVDNGINGEMKPILITFDEYKDLLKINKEFISEVEDIIIEGLDSKKISFDIFIYEEESKKYKKDIESKRLTVITLSLLYLLFDDSLQTYYPESIVKLFDNDTPYVHSTNYHIANKYCPLTMQEDYNSNKLNFGNWRDFIIMNTVSMLGKSKIIPSYTETSCDWFRFRSSKDLFVSKTIADEYKVSATIEKHDEESDYYENNFKILADVTLSYNMKIPNKVIKKPNLDVCNLFELLYTMWYLHHELKIIHTKLNNPKESILCFEQSVNKNNLNTYIIEYGGEKDTYVFNCPSHHCTIYNFKSSIVMLSSPLITTEKIAYDNSQLYQLINVINDIIEIDISPEDIKSSIKSKDYWYDIYVVICAIDYVDICNYIIDHSTGATKDLASKVLKECTNYLNFGLDCIVNKQTRPEITFHTLWDRIRQLFNDYHYSEWNQSKLTKGNITDRYVYDELFNKFPSKEYQIL